MLVDQQKNVIRGLEIYSLAGRKKPSKLPSPCSPLCFFGSL
jgi:hypothetical protein